MKDLVAKRGLEQQFFIASAATSSEEIWNGVGNPVYPPAKKELAKHGLSCEGKRAVQLRKDDYEKYDYFVYMDSANERNMLRIFGADPEQKMYKLLTFAGSNRDVADPWYTGNFDATYKDALEGCIAFLDWLCQKYGL